MTRRIPHRELRNDSSRILREVAAGETVEITNHGEVVAVLGPPNQAHELGGHQVHPAKRRGGFSAIPRVRAERSSAELLDELRADRR